MLPRFFIAAALLAVLSCLTASVHGSGIKYEAKDGKLTINSTPLQVKGAIWYGMASTERVVQGIWPAGKKGGTTIPDALKLLKKNKFNAIRIGLAVNLILEDPESKEDQVGGMPELVGKTYLEVLDELIYTASQKDMLVLLVNEKLNNKNDDATEPWFTSKKDVQNVEKAMEALAKRYCKSSTFWNVMGIDLQEEPIGSTWGSGDKSTDWNTAAESLGNKVLSLCPEWLILVQGTDKRYGKNGETQTDGQRGGVLQGVEDYPLKVDDMTKLVYSPHFQGISKDSGNDFWSDKEFPDNMPAVWDTYFGFVPNVTEQPLIVGYWGDRAGKKDTDKVKWQKEFVKYVNNRTAGSFYYAFNFNDGEIDGLVDEDWESPKTEKFDLLEDLEVSDLSGISEDAFPCSDDSDCGQGECSSKTCECATGWKGFFCDYCPIKESCLGGERCVADKECGQGTCESKTCKCTDGFKGPTCDICVDDGKESCNDNGKCSDGKCTCTRGYEGVNCEIDLCKETDCGSSSAICDLGQCVCRFECVGNDCTSCSKDGSSGKSCGECPNASSNAVAPVFSVLCALVALSVGAKTEFIM